MATQKPKIQGYIEQSTFDCFEIYRQENNLSQSHALEKIVASFFGNKQELQPDRFDESWQRISQELRKLQERVARLEITSNLDSNLSGITSNLKGNPQEITSNLDSNLSCITSNPQEITGNLDSNLSCITSNLESESLDAIDLTKGVSQRSLAKRLNCSHTLIAKYRSLGEIEAYSKQHDPVGIAWDFRNGKYYPVLEDSSDRQLALK